MKGSIASAAMLAAMLLPSALARQQLLKNGSFEILTPPPDPVLSDWTQFGGAAQSNVVAFDRDFSVLASVRTNGFVGVFQDVGDAVSGDRILMKALAYHPASAPLAGNVVAGMKLEFFPPGGTGTPDPVENLAFDSNDPVLDTWTPVSLTTTVPEGINLARVVVINFDETMDNGFVYADTVRAELGSAPGVNQLTNDSFETGGSGPDGMNPPWDEFADESSSARKVCDIPPAHSGDCMARMGGLTSGLAQSISVTPGDTITVSAFFLATSSGTPYFHPDARAGVKVEWVAGTVPTPNIDVAPNANPISGTTNVIRPTSPTDTWLPISIDFTMPTGNAASLRSTLITAFGPRATDVYFDAFEIVLTNVFDGSDVDADDDQDMLDMARLQETFTGSGGGMRFLGLVYDHDDDNDVDNTDASFTLPRMTGPATAP